jgi:hypothetical protein
VAHGGPGLQEAQPQLLALYVERVLGAKERPSAAALECWRGLIASATLEQLTGERGRRLPRVAVLCCRVMRCCNLEMLWAADG